MFDFVVIDDGILLVLGILCLMKSWGKGEMLRPGSNSFKRVFASPAVSGTR